MIGGLKLMKPIKLFLLMFLILFSSSVKAECTTKEINNLKKEADKITITYKHWTVLKQIME